MTFSVVERRPLLGTLRALGVTRGEVFYDPGGGGARGDRGHSAGGAPRYRDGRGPHAARDPHHQ